MMGENHVGGPPDMRGPPGPDFRGPPPPDMRGPPPPPRDVPEPMEFGGRMDRDEMRMRNGRGPGPDRGEMFFTEVMIRCYN